MPVEEFKIVDNQIGGEEEGKEEEKKEVELMECN